MMVLLEEGGGRDVGRDPRLICRDGFIAAGHNPMSPLKALRARCLDCCCGQQNEVRLCTAVKCPLWPFRMGSNPWRKEASDAQRERARGLASKRLRKPENNDGVVENPRTTGAPLPGCHPKVIHRQTND